MAGFCKNCGAPREDGKKFCSNCGIAFDEKKVPGNNAGNQQPRQSMTESFVAQRNQPHYNQRQQYQTPPPQQVYRHPYVQQPQRPPYGNMPQKKKSHGGAVFGLILAALAAVFVITAFFKPGFLRDKVGLNANNKVEIENKRQQGKTVKLSNGVLSLDGLSVDFSGTGASDGSVTLTEEKGASFEKENGLVSELFSISYDEDVSGPVKVTLPVPEEYDASQDGVLRLGIGRDYTREDGVIVTPFEYLDAEISDGVVTAYFDPSMYPETAFFGRADNDETGFVKTSLKSANTKKYGKVKRYVGMFLKNSFYYENGHFEVWYPFNLKIDSKDRELFLSDLESIYSFYEAKGYMMGDKYPMDVNISRAIEDQDGYSEGTSITLKASLLFGEEKKGGKTESVYPSHQTASRELLKHEFFHTIQVNYLGWMAGHSWSAGWQESVWFDEATAVYYEADETGSASSAQSNKFMENVWDGLIPYDKMSADAGYARGPMVAFVTEKLGSDEWIKTVYNSYYEDSKPLNDSVRAYIETIPNAASEFYNGYVTGKYYSAYENIGGADHIPRLFYKAIVKNKSPRNASSSLTIAEPANKKLLEEAIKNREPFTLEEEEISLYGTAAYLFALNCSLSIDDIPEDYQVSLYCDGCEVSLYEVSTTKKDDLDRLLSGKTISLKQLEEALINGRNYLALVVSNAPIGEKMNTTFKVVLEPSDSTLTGTWSVEGEGSYSSGLLDPLVGLLEKYAGESGVGDLLGLSGYGDLYRDSQNSVISGGRMTIENTGDKNVYDVKIKFGNGAPVQGYRGTYDPSSKEMVLKQKDTTYTDSDGNTIDLEKLGMTATLTFTFATEKDPETGAVKQTFTGTGGQSSSIVSTSGNYRGEKLSDSIEALE